MSINADPNPKSAAETAPARIKLLFLVGMPGVGKTYWGNEVAHELGLNFVDLDNFIAAGENASIPALFATYGEKGFREREQAQLKKLIKSLSTNTIVACGGGTPCYSNNMAIIKDAGTAIYLKADIPTLLDQLSRSSEARPLLKNRGNLGTYLASLLETRKVFYNQANHILQTKDISVATFAKIISNA